MMLLKLFSKALPHRNNKLNRSKRHQEWIANRGETRLREKGRLRKQAILAGLHFWVVRHLSQIPAQSNPKGNHATPMTRITFLISKWRTTSNGKVIKSRQRFKL
jgi:lauroyl/myristoyl acyltransferase